MRVMSCIKSVMKYTDSPDNAGRIPLLNELARSNHLLINNFDNFDLSDMVSEES